MCFLMSSISGLCLDSTYPHHFTGTLEMDFVLRILSFNTIAWIHSAFVLKTACLHVTLLLLDHAGFLLELLSLFMVTMAIMRSLLSV